MLDVPVEAGRSALGRLDAAGIDVGPITLSGAGFGDGRMLFFTATRGTPDDEDEWWPCELDCHPETMDEHPGLRWHCRGSYVLLPPSTLPGEQPAVTWLRGPELPLPDPLTLLESLTDACAEFNSREPYRPRSGGLADRPLTRAGPLPSLPHLRRRAAGFTPTALSHTSGSRPATAASPRSSPRSGSGP